jgi:hypothetical protein
MNGPGHDPARSRRRRADPAAAHALAVALALVVLAAAHAGEATAPAAFPKRKAGLWEVRSVASQAAGLAPTRHCVGEQTDVESSHLDRQPGTRGACSLGAFRRAGDAWLAESVCREGRTVVTSRAVATGDFATEYRIDTHVTYDPPLGGVRREDKEAVVARWLGPCGPKQKPGDMVIPGMGTLNMVDGTFKAESRDKR